jgi:hypothetical protein
MLRIRHAYGRSSPLAIAGLGLLPGFTTTVPVAGGAAGVVLLDVLVADALGNDALVGDTLCDDSNCVVGGLLFATLWF